MSLNNLMAEIGEDADLLTRSDQWLEHERIKRSEELERAAHELRTIQLAQKIKKQLQQKNLVPVQQIVKDSQGNVQTIIVKILNLPDALSILRPGNDTLDEINQIAQLETWRKDGYDIDTSLTLRNNG